MPGDGGDGGIMRTPTDSISPKYAQMLLLTLSLYLCLSVSSHYLVSSFVPPTTCRHQERGRLSIVDDEDHSWPQRHLHSSNIIPCSNIHPKRIILCSSTSTNDHNCSGELKQILQRYGLGSRLVTLTNADLSKHPIPAEMYEGGSWKLCLVVGLRSPSSSSSTSIDNQKPPLLDVLAINDDGLLQDKKVLDIGQLTTIWQDLHKTLSSLTPDALAHSLQSNFNEAQESLQNNILPIEQAMQNLYNGRIANRSRPPSYKNRHALTKKQIPKIISQVSNPSHLEDLLRNLLKVGEDRMSRMVDSTLATDYLYSDYCRDGDDELIIRRLVAAQVLSEDSVSGGRFKRRSCQFVSAQYGEDLNPESREVQEVTLVNGGWIAVDPSIKAGTEGRKFAATSNNAMENSNTRNTPLILTAADERIAHRLECLAMGDVWSSESNQEEDDKMLELDVRQALTSMNLPLTPEGAASALIKIGRWSEDTKNDIRSKKANKLIEPWSPDLLDAARSLAIYENKRRESLAKKCFSSNKKVSKKANTSPTDGLEGRVDLSSLPCVCIDAKRATFRDDAIGIRLRSSTGRRVNKTASKWEILVHIADVSDIYIDGRKSNANISVPSKKDVQLLRQAAERRGQSRYDLPLGK